MESMNVKSIICVIMILAMIVLAEGFPWATEREVRCNDPGQISNAIRTPAEGIHSAGSVVHFRCLPGYTLNGTTNLTCMSNGQWSDNVPVCQERVFCKEPEQIRNGKLNTSNKTYSAGETVFYECLPGFEIQGEASLTCTQNGNWSTELPRCKREKVVCKDPGRVKNGRQSTTRKTYSVGSKILYRCLSGYKIDGKASIICMNNGKWSHKVPSCKKRALRCKDPGKIRYGKRSVQIKRTHRIGTKILYQCYSGYQVNGTASIMCKNDGNWSSETPTCQPVSCGKPSTTNHGNYTGNGFTYRSVVTYKCDVGYKLIGRSQRKCRSNGKWTKKPRCEIYRCRIRGTLRIRHGTIRTTDKTYSHGSTLLFKCKKGYELVGTDSIACLEGKWTARRLPYCKVKACPNPGFPDNGRRIGNNFRIGHSVRFTCQSGFKLTGSPVRTCLKNKQWSGSVAVCDDGSTDCPILGTPISGIKIGNRYNFGSVIRFECKEGYILTGSSIRRCTFNGKWNGTEAKCVDEFHYYVSGVNETALFFRKNMDVMLQYTCSGLNATCNTSNSGIDTRARALELSDEGGGLDVLFVFDASSSIKKKEFELAVEFAQKVVEQLGATWKSQGTRVAAIIYGTQTKLVFNLGSSGAKSVKGVKKKLSKIRKLGGGTATRKALELAQKVVFPKRKSARQRAMFFLTDGRSNIGGPPEKAAKVLRKEHNVEIYAIGVGKEVNRRELHAIAVNKDDVVVVKDFDELVKSINKAVTIKVDYSPCGESTYDPRGRMVGGIKAMRGRWPWQVGLHSLNDEEKLTFFCGGALIEKRWVLTAAHCFNRKNEDTQKYFSDMMFANKFTIKVGDHRLNKKDSTEQESIADDIFIHQDYNIKTFNNDIALIKLKKEFKLGPFVRTVCLPKTNKDLLKPGKSGIVAGWGYTKVLRVGERIGRNEKQTSNNLRQSAFTIQNDDVCKNATIYHKTLNMNVTFCAGDGKGRNDTCKGDSGGSFVRHVPHDGGVRWVTAGLVSWGEGCGVKGKYGYYTRVASFVDWIRKTIKDNK